MSSRTGRDNRVGLALTGLVLVTAGGLALARGRDVLPGLPPNEPVLSEDARTWTSEHDWVWLAVAGGAALVAVLALLWLLGQLRRDRLHDVPLPVPGQGRVRLEAAALTGAVTEDVDSYRGVSSSRAHLAGSPDAPVLYLSVHAQPRAELDQVLVRVHDHAVTRARTALGPRELRVVLRVTVDRREQPERGLA